MLLILARHIHTNVLTEKKLSKKVRNHHVMYTVTTIGNSTALHSQGWYIVAAQRSVAAQRQEVPTMHTVRIPAEHLTSH